MNQPDLTKSEVYQPKAAVETDIQIRASDDLSNKGPEQGSLERSDTRNRLPLTSANNTRSVSESMNTTALEKSIPSREDINILFSTLELPVAITSPSLELEVKVLKDLTSPLIVNGKDMRNIPAKFPLSCIEIVDRADNPQKDVKYWGIKDEKGKPTDEQQKFVRETYFGTTISLEGQKFSLHFQDFPLEQLENVAINLRVLSQNKVKAYYYTLLKGLQLASKKGKNVWLCMSASRAIEKLPLLHLKIEARGQSGGHVSNFDKFANTTMIEDTFYNYSFILPNVTPERATLLELFPYAAWNIIDSKTVGLGRSLNTSKSQDLNKLQTEFIQRIKYRLSKHYHETTSRQIAYMKESAYVWAELQEDILTYFLRKDKREKNEKSVLYADQNYINHLVTEGNEYQGQENEQHEGRSISYLFKRDLWESEDKWQHFYLRLEKLCKAGLPPQSRLDIWSEMSRVVYFIKFTEDQGLLNEPKKVPELNQSEEINNYDDILSRSREVYEILKEKSQKHPSIFYQNLEDDIRDLKASSDVSRLPYEHNLRHICRTFIYWTNIFSDPSKKENSQYLVNYSRTVATICYGFLVSQTCNFLEGPSVVEEHQIFWLLISLVTYILSSYFETNEKAPPVDTLTLKAKGLSRRRNVITQSALRCNQIKGIKSDLLVLKFLLRSSKNEKIQKVHEKFEELGLPLEYYFSDHMISLFFNLFNPGLTFRIWDVLFLEGSSANQVKCNRMIVCVLYTLLQECADQIVKAREGGDIKFIIEMYARFQTSYGDFLNKCYDVCREYFEQTIPNTDDLMGKWRLIKYAFFSDEYNKIDNATQKIEKVIESHFEQTLAQNLKLYEFVHKKCKYDPASDPEILSYPILYQIIHKFIDNYGNPKVSKGDRKFLRDPASKIWIKIYSITSAIKDARKTTLKVIYDSKEFIKDDCTPSSVNLEEEITAGAGRELKIEVSEESPRQPTKTKHAIIDLKTIPVNVITKLNLRLNDEDPNNVSDVELAIFIETVSTSQAYSRIVGKEAQPLLIRDLEDVYYNDFKIQNIQSSFASEIKAKKDLDDNRISQFSALKRSPAIWKETFVMTNDEFVRIMTDIAQCWSESDLRSIHKSITKASRNSVFYISDFFVVLILYVKGTLNQKYGLIFDLFTSFDAIRSFQATEVSPEKLASLRDLKGLACHLYDLFMIHIPYNQLENMIDLAVTGHASCIKQVIINEQIEGAQIEYSRQALNKISNFVHLNTHSKDTPIQTAEILKLLRKIYENEILSKEGRRPWLAQNTIDIIYFTGGRNHRMTLYVDQNWKPQEQEAHQHNEAVLKLFDCYRNVLPLTTPSSLYNKDQFIEILQRLPLINYLCSFGITDSTQTYMLLNDIKFTVLMGNVPLIAVIPSPDLASPKEDFADILRKWPTIFRQASAKPSSPFKIGRPDYINVPALKLDPFLSLSKILKNITKSTMRKFFDNYNQNETLGSFQSHLYTELFYYLDYDITIKMNNDNEKNIKIDPNSTPFLAIMDLLGKRSATKQRQNFEIVFSMNNSKIRETYKSGQLAWYLHSDGTKEPLACEILYKFQFDDKTDSSVIDGFGVSFEKFPGETFLKKTSEVVIFRQININDLELKRVDRKTNRVIPADQNSSNIHRSSTSSRFNDSNQRSQQQGYPVNNNQFSDPLTRSAQMGQKSKD